MAGALVQEDLSALRPLRLGQDGLHPEGRVHDHVEGCDNWLTSDSIGLASPCDRPRVGQLVRGVFQHAPKPGPVPTRDADVDDGGALLSALPVSPLAARVGALRLGYECAVPARAEPGAQSAARAGAVSAARRRQDREGRHARVPHDVPHRGRRCVELRHGLLRHPGARLCGGRPRAARHRGPRPYEDRRCGRRGEALGGDLGEGPGLHLGRRGHGAARARRHRG
mmetsp:Transcript_8046/g.22963  ORF Transcript_8046/g.22963 Transcript_8046/m.22963 type:complete len:225 (+) Transcript_8046:84-758(+)